MANSRDAFSIGPSKLQANLQVQRVLNLVGKGLFPRPAPPDMMMMMMMKFSLGISLRASFCTICLNLHLTRSRDPSGRIETNRRSWQQDFFFWGNLRRSWPINWWHDLTAVLQTEKLPDSLNHSNLKCNFFRSRSPWRGKSCGVFSGLRKKIARVCFPLNYRNGTKYARVHSFHREFHICWLSLFVILSFRRAFWVTRSSYWLWLECWRN